MRKTSLLVLAFLPAAAFASQALAADTLTAIKVAKAPVLAAGAADPAWAKAKALTVPLAGGANFKDGKTTATLKAVHSGDMLTCCCNMMIRPSWCAAFLPERADGSWKKLGDPNDKGGDDNIFYEDARPDLEYRRLDQELRPDGLHGSLPRRRARQALRKQVHGERGRLVTYGT